MAIPTKPFFEGGWGKHFTGLCLLPHGRREVNSLSGTNWSGVFRSARSQGNMKGTQIVVFSLCILFPVLVSANHVLCVPMPVSSRSGPSSDHRRMAGCAKDSVPIATAPSSSLPH